MSEFFQAEANKSTSQSANKSSSESTKKTPRVTAEVVLEQEFRHKKKHATRPVFDYSIKKMNLWAALGYLFFVIPLIIAPKNVFARFHANQALLFQIYMICINILGQIPIIGWWIILPLGNLLGLFFFLFGVIMAYNGWQVRIPLIGDFDFISVPEKQED